MASMSRAHGADETEGERAEREVRKRLRAALPPEYRVFPNVHWLGRTADHRGIRDGEADVVIAHPDLGFLVIEVKAGEIARDEHGRWWAGHHQLDPSPFQQASLNMHALLRKLRDLPDAPAAWNPITGHAVAFPDVDLASAGNRLRLLGLDVNPDLIFDGARLDEADPAATRRAVDRAFDLWAGESAHLRPPGQHGVDLLAAFFDEPVRLRSLLRSEIESGEREVADLTRQQHHVLRDLRRQRRAEIRGGAGTGKTMLALEKARRLAAEGFQTLLVCFNQPLARMLAEEVVAGAPALGGGAAGLAGGAAARIHVSTFHQLCEDLAREAGTLPARPEPLPQAWWNDTLSAALLEAIGKVGGRYQAIVVDEGQDFEADWLTALDLLLVDSKVDPFYVFHDPAQSLYRPDVVDQLGLNPSDLDLNCRNAQPIHALVQRFSNGELAADALRTDGRAPEIITAAPGAETIEALRVVLHRLRRDEGVRPWEIAVLTGGSLEKSDAWRHRQFGNEVLWNGQVDDAGRPTGLAADQVPAQPDDAILCDSIRRFKGLERPVIVLTELRADDKYMDRLLYVGISRARQHVVLVVTPEVAQHLGKIGS